MAFNVRQIFAILDDAEVDCVVVGGMAVILHGYLRATADLDLAIGLSRDNVARALRAFESIGLKPRLPVAMEDFADPAKRDEWRGRNMLVFPLWDPANPVRAVDVFIESPIAFDVLFERAVVKDLDGVPIRVASIEHLIAMKREAGRPRDLDDVAMLQAILDAGEDGAQ